MALLLGSDAYMPAIQVAVQPRKAHPARTTERIATKIPKTTAMPSPPTPAASLPAFVFEITSLDMLCQEPILQKLRKTGLDKVPLLNVQISSADLSTWTDQNAERLKLTVEYDASRKLPIIKAKKSTLHSALSNLFMLWFHDICKDKPSGSEGYKGTTEEEVILKQTNSRKYPDAALTKATKPLIAVEIGITQDLESLFADCHQYLRDDSVQAVFIVKIHEEGRCKPLDPPWGMSSVKLETYWKDDTLPGKVAQYHESKDIRIVGKLKFDCYFWSSERKHPPPSPLWSGFFDNGVSHGELSGALHNPMINRSKIRLFGKEYELPFRHILEKAGEAVPDEETKRIVDLIGQHITRDKRDLFESK